MKNTSPLRPQGALPPQARSNVPFKILMILGVHVVVIGGLLLQGCKEPKDNSTAANNPGDQSTTGAAATAPPPADTSAAPGPAVPTPNPVPPPVATAPVTAPPAAAPPAPAVAPVSPAPAPPAPLATGSAKEYVIARGDTLGAIARKNGISLSALEEANPGLNPRKLKIGQKLEIPASSMAAASSGAAPANAPGDAAATDTITYTVKAGDMLARIAKAHGTHVKTIMEMNDLKTTAIRVGQKLKLPSTKTAMAEAPTTSPAVEQTAAAPAPAAPASGSSTAPAQN